MRACSFVGSYAVNALSPILAGKFQVATTVIKLIPLLLMGIVGTIVGFCQRHNDRKLHHRRHDRRGRQRPRLFTAVAATAFAYEGWIIATSINAELRELLRRNLPIALVVGTLIVALTYILLYIGLSGSVSNAEIMAGGEAGAKLAFEKIRPGRRRGSVRAGRRVVPRHAQRAHARRDAQLYSVAARGNGPKPEAFLGIDQYTNMPANSAIVGVLMCAVWLTYLWCQPHRGLVRPVLLRLVRAADHHALRALYSDVPQRHAPGKELNAFHRYVMPVLSIVCCIFFCVAASCVARQKPCSTI